LGDDYTYLKYSDALLAFTLQYDYGKQVREESLIQCQREQLPEISARKSCVFDLEWANRCNVFRSFGYMDGCPCVALKLNPVYGWLPDVYEGKLGPEVRCDGKHDVDRQLLAHTSIKYYDARDQPDKYFGVFPHYYFPYLAQENYNNPLVFVEFCMPPRYTL
ncbi:ATPase, Na K transporting, beta, partial [Cichlidogyrus casuarinus]